MYSQLVQFPTRAIDPDLIRLGPVAFRLSASALSPTGGGTMENALIGVGASAGPFIYNWPRNCTVTALWFGPLGSVDPVDFGDLVFDILDKNKLHTGVDGRQAEPLVPLSFMGNQRTWIPFQQEIRAHDQWAITVSRVNPGGPGSLSPLLWAKILPAGYP